MFKSFSLGGQHGQEYPTTINTRNQYSFMSSGASLGYDAFGYQHGVDGSLMFNYTWMFGEPYSYNYYVNYNK